MNLLKKLDYLSVGLALFAMFFGAGNIIFPLALGRIALDQTAWGLSGLLLTAVVMPFTGLIAMFRYNGEVRLFFSRFGKVLSLVIPTLIISLLGPFGAAPRCIALAHSTLSLSFPGISLLIFSISACIIIFLFSIGKNRLLKLLGFFLSPLKIALLALVIVLGFKMVPEATYTSTNMSHFSHFWTGLTEGYNTMDLLAAFFFAPIVITSLARTSKRPNQNRFLLIASLIGATLLALIYTGFCSLAYFYAPQLEGIPNDQLLGAIAIKILGAHAGLIVSLTVTFACLTTAIALIAAFASFVEKEILRGKINYKIILITSLLTTCVITTLEFQGIARFLNPVLEICYPALILITLYNLIRPLQQTIEQQNHNL